MPPEIAVSFNRYVYFLLSRVVVVVVVIIVNEALNQQFSSQNCWKFYCASICENGLTQNEGQATDFSHTLGVSAV